MLRVAILIINNRNWRYNLSFFKTKKKIEIFKITKNTTNISTLVSLDIHKISGDEKKIDVVNKLSSFLTKDFKKK